jgi:hypothetical protein
MEEIGICSISQAKYENGNVYFNENMANFGSHGIAILNPKEFLDRVVKYAKTNSISFESKVVEYVDGNTYNGEMGIFRKMKEYELQNEIRFAVYNRPAPFKMMLGSLKDISGIINIKNANIIE